MAGTGKGAENGILFKRSRALETAAGLDVIVMDKTGTITQGKPAVGEVMALIDNALVDDDLAGDDHPILTLAASLEKGSEHPIGRAIVAHAEAMDLTLTQPLEFKAHAGLGIEGRIEETVYYLGKPGWFGDGLQIEIPDAARTRVQALQSQGKTVVVLADETRVRGLITVTDPLKPDSAEAIAELQQSDLKTVMLTGDNLQTARTIGKDVGVDDIVADVRPDEKSGKIQALQAEAHRVGMVGDGINDAPALARADIGFAIGTGTDVAIETGDIILSSGRLTGIPKAIRISRQTMATIRQNLFFAFVYNIVLIPLAAGVLAPFETVPDMLRQLHPILAALAMAASSISVVTNSLRLYRRSF
jgi:Cu+-exporting ATPase